MPFEAIFCYEYEEGVEYHESFRTVKLNGKEYTKVPAIIDLSTIVNYEKNYAVPDRLTSVDLITGRRVYMFIPANMLRAIIEEARQKLQNNILITRNT